MEMHAFPQIPVIPEIHPRRATRDEEKEESASHHVKICICFAQLRAEMCEKDSWEARRLSEIMENHKLWDT